MTDEYPPTGQRLTGGDRSDLPGSDGEHELQERFETVDRADPFYAEAMQSSLTGRMRSFLADRWLGFVGWMAAEWPRVTTAVGEPGMVRIVDDETIALPADRTVRDVPSFDGPRSERYASFVTVDWWDSTVGLHVNGVADRRRTLPVADEVREDWIVLEVEEAYIHCAKHIPQLTVDDPAGVPSGRTTDGRSRLLQRALARCVRFVPLVNVDAPTRRSGTVEDHLSPAVREFVTSRILGFLATADRHGETDVSPRLGPEGFVQVLDDTTVAWPEYRGNGIHASLGNIHERSTASMTFVDWWNAEAIVTIAGDASIKDAVDGAVELTETDRTKSWVVLDVDMVSVDVDPPIPRLSIDRFDPPWGTDDRTAKKSGFFTE